MDNAKFVEEGNPHDLLLSKLDSKQLEVYHELYRDIENTLLKNDKELIANFDSTIEDYWKEEHVWREDIRGERVPLTEDDIPEVFEALLWAVDTWLTADFENADGDGINDIEVYVDDCLLSPRIRIPGKAATEMYQYDSKLFEKYVDLKCVEAEEPDTREVYSYDDYAEWGDICIYIRRDTDSCLLHNTNTDACVIVDIQSGSVSDQDITEIRLESE